MARESGGAEGKGGWGTRPSWAQGHGREQAEGPSPWDFMTQEPRAAAAWLSAKDQGRRRPVSRAGSANGLRQARPGPGFLTVTFDKGGDACEPDKTVTKKGLR